MAFQEIGPSRGCPVVGVTVSNSLINGNKKHTIVFRVGPPLLDKLGWEHGDRITVLWGDGADFGKVRLCKNVGGLKLIKARGAVSMFLGTTRKPDSMSNTKHFATESEYIVDDGLLITLPDWFYPAAE